MPDANSAANPGGMKKFYLKLHNSDVICVHQPDHSIETPKMKFIHSLIGCQFLIKSSIKDSYIKSHHYMDSRNSLAAGAGGEPQAPAFHQIQIKLSEKHKRVFFVASESVAAEIARKMKRIAEVRDIEDDYELAVSGGNG